MASSYDFREQGDGSQSLSRLVIATITSDFTRFGGFALLRTRVALRHFLMVQRLYASVEAPCFRYYSDPSTPSERCAVKRPN